MSKVSDDAENEQDYEELREESQGVPDEDELERAGDRENA